MLKTFMLKHFCYINISTYKPERVAEQHINLYNNHAFSDINKMNES